MAAGWLSDETRTLISIWGEQNVQTQLDSVKRNKDIYEKIAFELSNMGYTKTWKQCRVKVKNLTQKYRKVKDKNRVSGTSRISCPFYDEIDAILGTRAASQPPTLLESGKDKSDDLSGGVIMDDDDDEVNEGHQDTNDQVSDTSCGEKDSLSSSLDINDDYDISEVSPSHSVTTNNSITTESSGTCTSGSQMNEPLKLKRGKKGSKRKATCMQTDSQLLKEMVTLFNEFDKAAEERYEERQENRMKMFIEAEDRRQKACVEAEEKQRQDERRHEEHMQYMFMSFMHQTLSMMNGNQAWNGYTKLSSSQESPYPQVPPFPAPFSETSFDNTQ